MTDEELAGWIADCSPSNDKPPALDGVPRDVFLRMAERLRLAENSMHYCWRCGARQEQRNLMQIGEEVTYG